MTFTSYKSCCVITIIAIVKLEDSYSKFNGWNGRRSLPVSLLLACYRQSVDSKEGISKAVSLFERHLNIDPVSLFKSEGATSPEHLLATMKSDVAMTRQPFTRKQCHHSGKQVLAKFRQF